MITTNRNKEISEIITKGLEAAGSDIVINLEESITGDTELKIDEGMFINHGCASQDYLTSISDNTLHLDNPLVVVVGDPIKEISDIIKTLEYIKALERPLILFSPEIKKEPLSVLLYNSRKENMKAVAINIPDYIGDNNNKQLLRDICSMTGSKYCSIDDIRDNELEANLQFEEIFGAATKAKINEYETILMGVSGDNDAISDMIGELQYKIKNEENEGYKSFYEHRLSRLQGKSVTISIGGITPVEIAENRDQIVDSLNSCKTALEYGILPGGGAALVHGLKELEVLRNESISGWRSDKKGFNVDVGVNVFYNAINVSYV